MLQLVSGMAPPHRHFSPAHKRVVWDYLWANGAHPFAPFGESATLSQAMVDVARRNAVLVRLDAALQSARAAVHEVDEFAQKHLYDPFAEGADHAAPTRVWVDRLFHQVRQQRLVRLVATLPTHHGAMTVHAPTPPVCAEEPVRERNDHAPQQRARGAGCAVRAGGDGAGDGPGQGAGVVGCDRVRHWRCGIVLLGVGARAVPVAPSLTPTPAWFFAPLFPQRTTTTCTVSSSEHRMRWRVAPPRTTSRRSDQTRRLLRCGWRLSSSSACT